MGRPVPDEQPRWRAPALVSSRPVVHPKQRRRGLVGLLSFVLVACGSTTPSNDVASTQRTDETAITAFVETMIAGDIESAFGMLCPDWELPSGIDPGLPRRALDRILDAAGVLSLARIEVVEDPFEYRGDPLAVAEKQVDPTQYRVFFSSRGKELADPLIYVVVGDPSSRQVCTAEADRRELYDRLVDAPPLVDLGSTTRSPSELVPEDIGPGFTLSSEKTFGPGTEDAAGLVTGLLRIWQRGEGGPQMQIRVGEFETAADAAAWVDGGTRYASGSAIDLFEVPGGLTGRRYIGASLMLIQPPEIGPHTETVTFQMGTSAAGISSFQTGPAEHQLLIALAEDLAALAAGPQS